MQSHFLKVIKNSNAALRSQTGERSQNFDDTNITPAPGKMDSLQVLPTD